MTNARLPSLGREVSRRVLRFSLSLCAGLLAACGSGGGGGGGVGGTPGGNGGGGGSGGGGGTSGGLEPPPYQVLATTDGAVSWVQGAYATIGILPPHAVVRAQVVQRDAGGKPALLDGTQVDLYYDAVADADGSINSTSLPKSDLWSQPAGLPFLVPLASGGSLGGLYMPADAPLPGRQAFAWVGARGAFEAAGIPIFPIDDAGLPNERPRLRVTAVEHATGLELGHTDLRVPTSAQTGCVTCHVTGSLATARAGVTWSTSGDLEQQSEQNILLLHDAKHSTGLVAFGKTIGCGMCHYSREDAVRGTVAPSVGVPGTLSASVHGLHAAFLPADGAATTCGTCHPAAHLARGAMSQAGASCGDCHGTMLAVAGRSPLAVGGSIDGTNDGNARRPWLDLPRCESCHTGDAVDHLSGTGMTLAADGIRLTRAYLATDAAASPLRRDASRFAAGTRYANGKGHSGLACQSCHGTSHAEWSRAAGSPQDDAVPAALQGHAGALVECAVCHVEGSLPLTTDGPHGMHNVNDARWAIGGHSTFYAADPTSCQACHGKDLAGTALSRAAAERVRDLGGGRVVTIAKGQAVSCGLCHASHDTSATWVSANHGPAYGQNPVACQGCHGTDLAGTSLSKTVADRSYTVAGKTVSIPAGTSVSCSLCHVTHGTDLAWVSGTSAHGPAYVQDPAGCTLCHGADLAGTSLSVAAANRSYSVAGKTYSIAAGTKVACATCHVPHATTSTWVTSTHGGQYETDHAACTSCHGTDLAGTVLSKTAASRSYTFGQKTVTFAAGATVACGKCHVPHATTSTFVNGHWNAYDADKVSCRLCHGHMLDGTSLSVTAAARTYTISGNTYTIPANTKVACNRCHGKP